MRDDGAWTTSASGERGRGVLGLDDLSALSTDERARLARALAYGGDECITSLARRLLDEWDNLTAVARTAGLVVLASALSWQRSP